MNASREKRVFEAADAAYKNRRLRFTSNQNPSPEPRQRALDSSPKPQTAFSPQPKKESYLPSHQRGKDRGKKTLVLDLDETLVHSSMEPVKSADIQMEMMWENKLCHVSVQVRPGALEFLQRMTKIFEVVIFTASVSNYANPLIDDNLDPNHYGFYKLYREHCTYKQNAYVKDLSRIGRDLKDVIIVDNLPHSYRLQPANGVPISSWYDDKSDQELFSLGSFLENLSKVDDVRPFISKIIQNDKVNYKTAFAIFAIDEEENKDTEMSSMPSCDYSTSPQRPIVKKKSPMRNQWIDSEEEVEPS